MLLIIAIAAIIGLFISVSKSIRFLRQEDTKSAKKFAWIAVAIVLVYALVSFIVNKFFSTSSSNSIPKGGFMELAAQQLEDKKNRKLDDAEFIQDVTLDSHRENVGTVSFKKGDKIQGILIDNQTPHINGSNFYYAPQVIGKFEFTFEGEVLYVERKYIKNYSELFRMTI